LRRAERGAKIFEVFRVKKSRFYTKKSYFFQLRREARNFWGISCEKSRFYAKQSYFFPIIGDLAGIAIVLWILFSPIKKRPPDIVKNFGKHQYPLTGI
jgi:hypothetical protein